jgi:hypothetical protein
MLGPTPGVWCRMDYLLRHFGVDWLAICLTAIALYRLGNGRRDGFLFGIASNLAWAVFAVLVLSAAALLANVLFLAMNLRGWMRWRSRGTMPWPQHEASN